MNYYKTVNVTRGNIKQVNKDKLFLTSHFLNPLGFCHYYSRHLQFSDVSHPMLKNMNECQTDTNTNYLENYRPRTVSHFVVKAPMGIFLKSALFPLPTKRER